MAENDIYNNKKKYGDFKQNLHLLAIKPEKRKDKFSHRYKYYCKNKENLKHFKRLFSHLESKDISYIRRNRLIDTLKLICNNTSKDLAQCERTDINQIVTYMHNTYNSPQSKADFVKGIKYLWKILFPEKDEKGRYDETLVPYVVRHLSAKMDKSREKLRNERLSWEEFEQLLNYFSNDLRMQAYLFLALESLGRPQEILYTKIKDVEIYDNYAKVYISEHGKEGTGFLQSIDSFPYVSKWYNKHPLKHNKNAFFFLNYNNAKNKFNQFKPKNVNKLLHNACKYLGIDKSITAYSLKRNGVTFRRLRGDSDVEIQHAARWTSTKQLKTYDLSGQEDALQMELIKRGIIDTDDPRHKHLKPSIKVCMFCNTKNALNDEICINCNRPVDRKKIRQMEKTKENYNIKLNEELKSLKKEINQKNVSAMNSFFKPTEIQDLFKVVYKLQKEIELMRNK